MSTKHQQKSLSFPSRMINASRRRIVLHYKGSSSGQLSEALWNNELFFDSTVKFMAPINKQESVPCHCDNVPIIFKALDYRVNFKIATVNYDPAIVNPVILLPINLTHK